MDRRLFLQTGVAASLITGVSPLALAKSNKAKVVIVGGGYAGATAAKYVRLLSNYKVDVTLIEPNKTFVSCPMSNLVVGGLKQISDVTTPYTNLTKKHGVRLVHSMVSSFDPEKKTVTLADGKTLPYDKLVMAPGIDMIMSSIEGLQAANDAGVTIQAWKAGPDTLTLRKQLEAMADGGVYAISIPKAPYRCPPGPYERASLVANYFKQYKPKSKVLILDANDNIVSKAKLFSEAWKNNYGDMVEYRPKHQVMAVDAAARTLRFEFENPVQADVLNVLPDMRGGKLAVDSGVANLNKRWADVNYQTWESKVAKDVHVIGDTVQGAPQMPKSAHMANSQAKVVAAAIVAQVNGWEVNPTPLTNNTCYSYINTSDVIHVASVHLYNAEKGTYLPVDGSGGVSKEPNALEGKYAWSWAQNVWADTLG